MPRRLVETIADGPVIDDVYLEEDGTYFHDIYHREDAPAPAAAEGNRAE